MTYDELVGAFAERVGVGSDEALGLLLAALDVLSERTSRGELLNLASQLPEGIAAQVHPTGEGAEAFAPDEFVTRLVQRTDADVPTAISVMRALFTTLRQALSSGEYEGLMSQLTREYRDTVPPTSWRGGPIPAWGLED